MAEAYWEDDDAFLDSFEDDPEDDESLEDDGEDDSERRRRGRRYRRRKAPKTAQGRQPPVRSTGNYVTQAQFTTAINRLNADARRNGAGIQQVNSRLNTLGTQFNQEVATNARQDKRIKEVKSEVDSTKQVLLFTALLGGGEKTFEAKGLDANSPDATREIKLKEKSDTLTQFLPLMMLGGGLGGGNGKGMFDNPLMLIFMLKAFEK